MQQKSMLSHLNNPRVRDCVFFTTVPLVFLLAGAIYAVAFEQEEKMQRHDIGCAGSIGYQAISLISGLLHCKGWQGSTSSFFQDRSTQVFRYATGLILFGILMGIGYSTFIEDDNSQKPHDVVCGILGGGLMASIYSCLNANFSEEGNQLIPEQNSLANP